MQRHLGALHHGVGADGEIESARQAAVESGLACGACPEGAYALSRAARGADGTGGREHGEELKGANGGSGHLALSPVFDLLLKIVDSVPVAFGDGIEVDDAVEFANRFHGIPHALRRFLTPGNGVISAAAFSVCVCHLCLQHSCGVIPHVFFDSRVVLCNAGSVSDPAPRGGLLIQNDYASARFVTIPAASAEAGFLRFDFFFDRQVVGGFHVSIVLDYTNVVKYKTEAA